MNKLFLSGGIVLLSLGVISTPYFMGKAIESNIDSYIKDMDRTGITITYTTKVSYLETISNGKIIINNGVGFLKNLSKNHLDDKLNKSIEKSLLQLKRSDKRNFNKSLNGMEFEYQAIISNINSEPVIDGYILKLSDSIEKEIKRKLSKKKIYPMLEKIDSMIKDKKFAFTFKDNRVSIKDIKEEISKGREGLKVNLEGLSFGETDIILKTLDFKVLKNQRDKFIIYFDNLESNYNIKDSRNYKSNTSINKISIFGENKIDINIKNLNYNTYVETNNNRANIGFSLGIDKTNFTNRSLTGIINKIDFNIKADLNADAFESINFNANSKEIQKQLQNAFESILIDTPKLKLGINSKGMTLNGKNLSSQVKANLDLKLSNIKSMNDIERSLKANNNNFLRFLEGSSFKIVADEKATNTISPLLLSKGIRPMKSEIEGFNKVVGIAKNGSVYVNDNKMF